MSLEWNPPVALSEQEERTMKRVKKAPLFRFFREHRRWLGFRWQRRRTSRRPWTWTGRTRQRKHRVYILTSRSRVLYVGVPREPSRRLDEHRSASTLTFCGRYSVTRLVRLEAFSAVADAIARLGVEGLPAQVDEVPRMHSG